MSVPGALLLVDADDTLWENAVFFHAARRRFIDRLAELGAPGAAAEAALTELETSALARREYGSGRLGANMLEVARRHLSPPPRGFVRFVGELVDSVRDHEIRYYEGVPETLALLRRRHRLVLLTMGDDEEQRGKLRRAEVVEHFACVEVVGDKTPEAYAAAVRRHGRGVAGAWMIGNSPSKDIVPARAAGLRTVLFDNGAPLPPHFREAVRSAHHVVRHFRELAPFFGVGEAVGLRPSTS